MLRRFSYGLLGTALASGAPLGLVALRLVHRPDRSTSGNVRAELVSDSAAYAYVTIATSIAFTLFGFLLGRQADHFERLSREDALTGLSNRRGFLRRLDQELVRAKRYRQPLALLFVDVDGFKRINDRHGHRVGDLALRHVAAAIQSELRSTDLGARWGGDEFTVLAPNTSEAAAAKFAERLRVLISRAGTHGHVTASIGSAVFDGAPVMDHISSQDLISASDDALSAAKREGRNRVASSGPPGTA